jgi:acetyl esterase/lipase
MGDWIRFAALVVLLGGCGAGDDPQLMSADDALALPRPAEDHRLSYGLDALQFGELRLPGGEGPHPVAVVVHGGCWLAQYDLGHVSGLADAIAEEGIATWSIEYRRVGDPGGGWPGTFTDVAAAADHVHTLASEYELDLDRVAVVGHSAGGHLALWLAGRAGLAVDDPLRGESPLALAGVVALAGIPDLAAYSAPEGCGAAVKEILGGQPSGLPDRLARTSPIEMLPLGIPQVLVVGELDPIVPPEHGERYAAAARSVGDQVELREVAGVGHFELIDPGSSAWPTVRGALFEILGIGEVAAR